MDSANHTCGVAVFQDHTLLAATSLDLWKSTDSYRWVRQTLAGVDLANETLVLAIEIPPNRVGSEVSRGGVYKAVGRVGLLIEVALGFEIKQKQLVHLKPEDWRKLIYSKEEQQEIRALQKVLKKKKIATNAWKDAAIAKVREVYKVSIDNDDACEAILIARSQILAANYEEKKNALRTKRGTGKGPKRSARAGAVR